MAPSIAVAAVLSVTLMALSALPVSADGAVASVEARPLHSLPAAEFRQAQTQVNGYGSRSYEDAEVVAPLLSIGLPVAAGLSTFYVSDPNQKIALLYMGAAMAGSGYFYIDEPVKGTLYSLGGPIALTAGGAFGAFLGGGFSSCSECYMPNPLPLMSAVLFGYAAMAAYLGWVGITVRDEARMKARPEDYAPPLRVPAPLGKQVSE